MMKVNEINQSFYKILIDVMTIHLILPNFVKYCKILSGTGKDQKILLNLALLHRKLSLNVSWLGEKGAFLKINVSLPSFH
jgi:hypothetical protein